MNGKKYESIIEQYERTDNSKVQRECMFSMIKTLVRNDLPHIWKILWVILVLELFKPEGWDIGALIQFLIKIFK